MPMQRSDHYTKCNSRQGQDAMKDHAIILLIDANETPVNAKL